MSPVRSDFALCRWSGFYLILGSVFFSMLASGCRMLSSSPLVLDKADARQAGALALYAKGLLLEGGEKKETPSDADREAAGTAFRQALTLDPDNRTVLAAWLANLNARACEAEALPTLEQFLARHPDDQEFRFETARLYEADKRPAEAARHCRIILAQHPENRELAHALIRLYFQSDEERKALRLIRDQHARFHDETSTSLAPQWALYFTRSEEQRPERALRCLELAIEQRTNNVEQAPLMTLAAENQLLLCQTNAATDTLVAAYRKDPTLLTPVFRLGTLWALRPDATNRLARLAEAQPTGDFPARLILAATQQALGDSAGALQTLRTYCEQREHAERTPEEGVYLWLGSLLEERKAYPDIDHLMPEALTAYPTSHTLKNFIAYLWSEQGVRLAEANRLVNEALAAEPENAAYLDTKGWVLFKSGRAFDALQFLLKAAERDRDEPVILDHVGDALMAVGRESEAIAFWTRSHQSDPQPAVAAKLRACGVVLK